MLGPIYRTQQWFEAACEGAGHAVLMFLRTVISLPLAVKRAGEIINQTFVASFGSMPVVFLTALFTGMILSLQAGTVLAQFGQESTIGFIVSASIVREMGPIFTALPLAGLMGSTYAAEIGTMKVSEEIDALEVMSIDPVQFLVVPRVIALGLACTVLTIFADVIGILGGGMVAKALLRVDFDIYLKSAKDILTTKDIFGGLLKSFVFGETIAAVSCSQGLRARHGAEGVGRATMRSVVISFVLILMFDYLLSWMIYQ